MSNLSSTFDLEWTIEVSNSGASLQELQTTKGGFLGNGKIGLVSAFDRIGVQKSILGTTFDFNEEGLYTNNVVSAFDFTSVQLFDNNAGPETVSSVQFVGQSLNMFTGICSTDLVITNTANSNAVAVSYDLYPVRHLPYCVVQSMTFTPYQNMTSLDVFHRISCCDNILVDDFNNNTIFNELMSPSTGVYLLAGNGRFRDTNKAIAVACSYIAEGSNFSIVGFNRYGQNRNACYQKMTLTDLVANTPYTLNILTTQMSGYDFRMPLEEVRRITVNIANVAQTPTQLSTLRQNHVNAWYNMWKSNITIEPKVGITSQETTDFTNVKRLLRYSMYNLWSSVREGIRTEVNPASLTVIDAYGTLFWDGDLWFLPLLTVFRPDIAKNVLEARYRVINKAIELAAGYGFSGSKYPYTHDITGYINAPYWDLNGPMHIFNTALVSIAIWNYYRITLDKDWLLNKGYTMLRNNADFFVSRVETDPDGSMHFRNVVSFNDKVSDDNSLTNYLIKTALKYCIEASYELNVVGNDNWGNVFYNIDLQLYNNDPFGIVKLDADSASGDTYKFLEMLIPLMNFYNETYFATNTSRSMANIQSNLAFYQNTVVPAYASNPLNNMILAWMNGTLINSDPDTPAAFADALVNIVDTNVMGLWGNLNIDNDDKEFHDNSLGAMFAMMLLTTIGTLRMTGVVTETRFYTEAMGYFVDNSSAMPKTFKSVKLTGVGQGNDTYQITNNVYYS